MNKNFLGFKRKDGSVGIRNKLLIISITGLTGPTARKISNLLQNTLFVDNPYGGGIIGEDKIRQDLAVTIRLKPFNREDSGSGKCIVCGKFSRGRVVFAKSY